MEKLKDCLPGLPEVGFHRWQSYLSLFSLKRPNLGFSGQRWAFPLRWCKGRLKRLYLALFAKGGLFSFGSPYFARGGLPVLPEVGFHRWQKEPYNNIKVGFEAAKDLRRLPEVGFFQRWAFQLFLWASLAFSVFDGIILPLQPEKPLFGLYLSLYNIKVGFEAAKDLRGCKGGLFLNDCQRWASLAAKVGFHRWQSSRLPELAELPKVGFSPLVLNDCQRWASLALFGLYLAFSPKVGFSCCLYTL